MTTEKKNIYQRLHHVMEAVGHVPKTGRNTAQGYNFVTEADVMNKVREACLLHGVVIVTSIVDSSQRELVTGKGSPYTLTTVITRLKAVNIDNPSEFVEWDMIGQGADSQDKGSNKAVTGSVKFGLLKSLLVGTNDDAEDDKNEMKDVAPAYQPKPTVTYAKAVARQEQGLPLQAAPQFDAPPPMSDSEVASVAFSLDDDTPDFLRPEPAPTRLGEVFKYKPPYNRKDEIKGMGARWCADTKTWDSTKRLPEFESFLAGAQ